MEDAGLSDEEDVYETRLFLPDANCDLHADAVIPDPRFYRAPYVGAHGWVSMRVEGVRDWAEVRALVLESYRLIAPKALWAVVQGNAPAETPARRKSTARSRPAARRRSGTARR